MELSPFKMIKALKELKRSGGMYLCDDCLERQVEKVTPEEKGIAMTKIKDKQIFRVMEMEHPCFVCETPTKKLIMIGDAMQAIKRASQNQ
jgi:hypothetical protein